MLNARRAVFLFAVVFSLTLADQASKLWAVEALTNVNKTHMGGALDHYTALHPEPTGKVMFAGAWGYFDYVENPGASWNILSGARDSFRYPFFVITGLVAMTLMLVYYFRAGPADRLRRVALACVIAGALGNFLDRVRLRYVIDFIVVELGSYRWPTFNVADAAISVGVVLLLLESFKQAKQTA
jgi:signal peptidase II